MIINSSIRTCDNDHWVIHPFTEAEKNVGTKLYKMSADLMFARGLLKVSDRFEYI